MGAFDKTLVTGAAGAASHVFDQPVRLDGEAGGYVLPAATASALGGVKVAAVTATVKSTSAAAAGDAPTKAEYDALRAEVEEIKAALNSVITNARAAGQAASK